MKIKINNRKNFNYLLIFIVCIIVSIPLLSKNLNIYFGSGLNKIAESYEFTKNFQMNDGKICAVFFNHLGSGNILLKSPLPIFVMALGAYFFRSFTITYKLIVFITLFFSGIYMHKFIDKVTQNKNISLIASLLYITAPFHLNEAYINNSLSNSLIFVFIPITFLGLYVLLNTTEYSYHLTFGIAGLILTDLNIAIITCIAILIYFIINFKNILVEHTRKELILNIIAIIGITAFFILPFIEVNFTTNYVGSNITKAQFLENRISVKSLFITENNSDFVYELGPHIIIMLAFSLMAFNRLKENRKEYIFCFFMMILYMFMSTKLFPWQIFPNSISKLETPSIFLPLAVFFEVIVASINMSIVIKKFNIKDVLIIFSISLIYVIALKGFIPYISEIYEIKEYNLTEISEIKYLPKKAYENLENLNNRTRDVEILKGSSNIYDKNSVSTYYYLKADTLENNTIYEFPYIYYPGYKITYDGIIAENFESENGLLAIKMNKEEGTSFEVNYEGTELMKITKIVSFVVTLLFIIYVYKKH